MTAASPAAGPSSGTVQYHIVLGKKEEIVVGPADAELVALHPWEEWVLARSLVGPIPEGPTEDDLFAGVRDHAGSESR